MSRDEAIRLALQVAEQEGWPWREPVEAFFRRAWIVGPAYWEVVSNANSRGLNARVCLANTSGAVARRSCTGR